jgi:hypothetical protein
MARCGVAIDGGVEGVSLGEWATLGSLSSERCDHDEPPRSGSKLHGILIALLGGSDHSDVSRMLVQAGF